MSVRFRLAKESDVIGISKVFAEAFDDLYKKRGFFEAPSNPIPPNPIFAFLIRKTPKAFWVAVDGKRIVGYSDSFMRGSFWYFAWLFISPNYQGKDVGRNLLERTLGSWKTRVTNRATITFSFNPVSQFLYMKYGMYPREPVYYAEAPGKRILENGQPTSKIFYEEMSSASDAARLLGRLDKFVLGFPLGWHHEYFFETKSKCYIFKVGGHLAGYAYVRPNGAVGPITVNSSDLMKPVLETALMLSARQGVEKVRYYMPGSNVHAVDLALKNKMRIDPLVFMSTRPFAKWENYVFHSAALM